MIKLLGHLVPEFELKKKAELVHEINELKRERGAIILGATTCPGRSRY